MTEVEEYAYNQMREELDRLRSIFMDLIEQHDPIGRIERVLDIAAVHKSVIE